MWYKVSFSGYALVRADSAEEAVDKFEDDMYAMKETRRTGLESAITFDELVEE